MNDTVTHPWAFGSRRVDLALFVTILLLMIVLSPRLCVYYGVTVYEISIEEIRPNGDQRTLATPEEFERLGAGYWRGKDLAKKLPPRISEYMHNSDWPKNAPAGTRYEWNVRWSENSTRLDQADRVVWKADQ
jgi:hypothetical protein